MSDIIQQSDLIDPEPLTLILGVTGFIGSLASLAAYIEYKLDKRNAQREQYEKYSNDQVRLARESKELLISIETDIMQLETTLRKLELFLTESTVNKINLDKIPLQFGSCKPYFSYTGHNEFNNIFFELHQTIGRSYDSLANLQRKIHSLDIDFTGYDLEKFLDIQHRLNSLLRKDQSYKQGFRSHYDLIVRTRNLITELRVKVDNHIVDIQ